MHPFRKTNTGQKILLLTDPSLWDNLLEPIKKANNLTHKYNPKKYCLQE